METKETKPVILLFPFPLQGHLNPMFQLANILFNRGFSITVIHTQFNAPSSSNCPNFRFVQISDGLSEKEASSPDVIELLHDLNSKCVGPFVGCLTKILSEGPASCVIVDALWYFTGDVSAKIGIPRIVLRTSNLCSFVPFAEFHVLREKGYLPLQESLAESPVPEFPSLRMKDLPWIDTRDPRSLDRLLSSLTKALKTSSGIIFNTIEEIEAESLEQIREEFPGVPIFCIGPFHRYVSASSSSLLAQDMTCISWLDTVHPKVEKKYKAEPYHPKVEKKYKAENFKKETYHPKAEVSELQDFPLIDLSCSDRSRLVHQIHNACLRFGFFQMLSPSPSVYISIPDDAQSLTSLPPPAPPRRNLLRRALRRYISYFFQAAAFVYDLNAGLAMKTSSIQKGAPLPLSELWFAVVLVASMVSLLVGFVMAEFGRPFVGFLMTLLGEILTIVAFFMSVAPFQPPIPLVVGIAGSFLAFASFAFVGLRRLSRS